MTSINNGLTGHHTIGLGNPNLLDNHISPIRINQVDMFGQESKDAKELRLLKKHVSLLTEALGKYVNPNGADDGQVAREALVQFITAVFKETDNA
jgi:hypothetical protein